VQRQMSFLETCARGAAPVWAALDDTQRAEVLAALARLIVKMAAPPDDPGALVQEEQDDE
jgi:hypothetical protein